MGIGLMLALRRCEPESLKRLRHEPGVQSRATDEVRFKANQLEGRDVRKWPRAACGAEQTAEASEFPRQCAYDEQIEDSAVMPSGEEVCDDKHGQSGN